LSISHCPKSGVNGAESNGDTRDSLSNAQMNMTRDSLTAYNDSSMVKHVGRDSTTPTRIEHGSDNPAKLDSIKNAKGKKKN
ncbi:MAG: hypothetical protein ABJB16_09295, partial [Saprospiraceae bacterium]